MRLAIVLLLATFSGFCLAAAPPYAPLAPSRLQELIRQLGSDDYQVRQQASKQLQQRPEAESALRLALHSSDAEVVRQAHDLLTGFRRDRLARALQRIKTAAKEGQADLLAEELVQWPEPDVDDACWQAVLDLGQQLLALERHKFKRFDAFRPGMHSRFPGPALRPYMKRCAVRALPPGRPLLQLRTTLDVPRPDIHFLARGERVEIDFVTSSLVAASSGARFGGAESSHDRPGGAVVSIILSGGSVEVGAGGVVAVCDGDFIAHRGIALSIIIARGAVRCSGTLADSVILAGGTVQVPAYMKNCTVIAGGDVHIADKALIRDSTIQAAGTIARPKKSWVKDSELKERVRYPQPPISFFEASSLGVQVAPSKYGVRVTSVAAGKPLARLHVADLVLAVDGVAVRTPDAFRRLLRKRLVAGGEAVFQVRRQGKTIDVRVRCLR